MSRYTQGVKNRQNIFIHRTIIVLYMYACIAWLSFLSANVAHAQSSNARQLKLSIEKTSLAYPFSKAKTLNVTLSNESKTTVRMVLDHRQSMRISMFDKTEVPVPLKKDEEDRSNSATAYTVIAIEPKSKYTFTIDIEDYVVISRPGVYKIQARYYPHLHANDEKTFIASRPILIPITDFTKNESLILPSETAEHRKEETMQQYFPDVVVTKMLHALQELDWDTYFTLIDLRSLYINTIESHDVFGTLSTAEQNGELTNFKKRIIHNSKNASDISPPDYFSVEKTSYTRTNAEVTTLIYNTYGESTAIKRFIFYLKRIHNAWKVVNYNAHLVSIMSTKDFEKNVVQKTPRKDTIVQKSDYEYPAPQSKNESQ